MSPPEAKSGCLLVLRLCFLVWCEMEFLGFANDARKQLRKWLMADARHIISTPWMYERKTCLAQRVISSSAQILCEHNTITITQHVFKNEDRVNLFAHVEIGELRYFRDDFGDRAQVADVDTTATKKDLIRTHRAGSMVKMYEADELVVEDLAQHGTVDRRRVVFQTVLHLQSHNITTYTQNEKQEYKVFQLSVTHKRLDLRDHKKLGRFFHQVHLLCEIFALQQ